MLALSYVLLAIGGWVSYEYYTFAVTRRKLSAIPTVGSDTFILAYLSAWKFLSSGRSLMQEGYEKYPNGVFKVATLETGSRWLVVVNTRKLISEIQLARDDVLSSIEFSDDMIQGQYTIGKKERFSHNGFEADLIRNNLMKGLPAWLPDIIEEIAQSFQDYLPPSDDWTPYTVEHTVVPIVNRTINLMLVDKPLCRDPEFLKIQQNFGMHVMLAAALTNITPGPFKKIAGYFACTVPRTVSKLDKFLAEKIEQRIRMKAEQGKEWDPSPNDFLSQLLDASPADCKNVYDMIVSVIVVNFAAIHTTSITASNVLIELALRPEYIEPLRKEIQDVVEAEGWTRDALDRMYKLDSFIKEIGRWKGIACTSVNRKAVKDFAFSNGVILPAGVSVCAPSASVHLDPNVYEDGPEFKGFRFSDKAKPEVKDQLTSPSPDFMLWGLGKHSCPGRWFAAVTIKCIIAHILINYDIKASDEAYPPPMWVGIQQIPDTKSKILFRKRQ